MSSPLNSTKAAALVESETSRPCSRQNLEKLCREGALQGSPCVLQEKPLRLDGDLLVAEYLARVSSHQSEARQPAQKRIVPSSRSDGSAFPRPGSNGSNLPDYTVSRSRSEYEKANLLELERQELERQLYRAETVEQAWGRAVNMTRTKILGVPSRAKQQIPHLTPDEIELLRDLLREALEELAAGEVTA